MGGVLVDWNPRHLYRKIFSNDAEMERFLAEVCNSEWNARQDAGRSWSEGVAEAVKQHPQYEAEIRAYHERWTETLNGAIDDTVALLEPLKRSGVRLLALTNWSNETFHFAEERFPFLTEFEGILVSGYERLAKPDPRIFNLLIERYHLNPQHTVFIDDNLRNVEGARNVGLHTLQFTHAQKLKQDLITLGVKFD
ncbi:HAD family hydrolase [Aggregatibacter actinomycetemcomitans serotype b str. SCC4092]|nr:HAD family phosphatase [Aggregatibacter actinomycetemcomitans]KND82852.1 HAD family hydrolase [Aggregatibacter actinomycetemcomitans serotype b str. SCC1398]KOE52494.1 HAD family hydrolase [Aggregatibacter actinomycetemcomitans serotype b str. SCC4092]KOE52885.1 HAD family hydrolase [Aggregatibacter actinomycetemcomitans serotype b str. S23A]KOE54558.1 HAD family hydrolase [Aggregatibacter actinomycetemcomitans serotype b str. I23C]KOE58338.1 HAD family hydrolase [Aggregatibacter actinomyce